MNAAGIMISHRGTGEPLKDVEFRDTKTNKAVNVMYIHDRNFEGVIPLPLAHAEGARLLLKMKRLRLQIFQLKLTNSRQYGIL